ncbi:MAG: hypothetical protein KDB61_01385 [Planctomycetes bacterium]|nr:hypothetical protein [Planctomycetota bacterium]
MAEPPIDLMRVDRALRRLGQTIEQNPEIAERTARYLVGELEGDPMPEKENTGDAIVRVPRELADRCEALLPSLNADPEIRALGKRVSRAMAVRLALLRGIEALERKAKTNGKG